MVRSGGKNERRQRIGDTVKALDALVTVEHYRTQSRHSGWRVQINPPDTANHLVVSFHKTHEAAKSARLRAMQAINAVQGDAFWDGYACGDSDAVRRLDSAVQ